MTNDKSRFTQHAIRNTFYRLLRLTAPYTWWIALAALLGAATIGSSIGLMATAAYIIASAALHPSVADLAVPIVGVRFFGIARGVFRYLERLVSHHVNFSLLARLRVWFYAAIEPLAPARLMSYRSGDLLTRIVSDIETLQNFYVRVIAPPVIALIIAIAMGLFLGGYAPALAPVVLTFMFLVGVVMPAAARRISQSANRRMVQARAELNVLLVDGIQGIADLIAFGREQAQAERVKSRSRELIHLQGRMAAITALHNASGNLLTHLAMWVVLLLAIPMVTTARLDGVYLSVLALATLASFEGVLALPLAFQYLESNLQAARRLFEIVDEKQTGRGRARTSLALSSAEGADEKSIRVHPRSSASYSITVENLGFRYAPEEPLALDHVSFELRAGESLAIVGPSGAGKTTFVNLLLRFWDDYEGYILLAGRDLRDYSPDEVCAQIGVVSQQTHLFNTTVRENLLLARPQAIEDEIVRAAQQAQIHDFICALPQGYDTLVGEQGLRLSGGERQRMAIARALLKDAPIIILDEPTANLDPLTERAVLRAISALTQQRTTLIITHRLVGLENVGEILVLCAGRVVERGTHAELLQTSGLYCRMWELQNAVLSDG